ncbi:MAG: hypothetical protein M3N13_02600 [Candidatus Eremiobacteraeota bacterium]|nr:hypothetical protein [Candidatus Eremiobacteraeota bacterium]
MPKTIGIVGSRRRDSEADLLLTYNALLTVWEPGDKLVSGGCPKGGDRFAALIARTFSIPLKEYFPDKTKLNPALPPKTAYARIAYARNTLIARDSEVLIACVAADRAGGTEDTIKKFCKRIYPLLNAHLDETEQTLVDIGRLVLA